MADFNYKEKSLDERKKESIKIMKKYPDRIPIICICDRSKIQLRKNKYLVPKELSMGQFMFVLRKWIDELRPEESLYIFVNNKLPVMGETINQLYYTEKDEDGFLYINIAKENTFG